MNEKSQKVSFFLFFDIFHGIRFMFTLEAKNVLLLKILQGRKYRPGQKSSCLVLRIISPLLNLENLKVNIFTFPRNIWYEWTERGHGVTRIPRSGRGPGTEGRERKSRHGGSPRWNGPKSKIQRITFNLTSLRDTKELLFKVLFRLTTWDRHIAAQRARLQKNIFSIIIFG